MRTAAAVAAVTLLTLTVAMGAAYCQTGQAPAQPQQPAQKPATQPAQPPAPQPAETPAPTPAPPAGVTILNNHEVEGILGREVRSTTDQNMGRIVDVIVDRYGQVRAAIIDFGGFLGVGSRKIAVDWNALQFPTPIEGGARITLALTPDQVKAAPEYQEGKPVVVLGALGKLEPLPFE
jgi:hypothetical protein